MDVGRIQNRTVVLGQGYVGLPVAVRAAEVGYNVVGFEVDANKVERLNFGESHVEDIPNARLQATIASGRYRATTAALELADFDVAVISVPTPMGDGTPDLSYIESACRTLAPFVSVGSTVILESTTYPGTTDELAVPLLEEGSGLRAGADFHVGYSPERIDPGNDEWGLENTPKVVSGIDSASLAAVQGFFERLVERTVPVSGTREAELTKLLENTFRHVNIALVNELAVFAHDLKIDVWESIDAASTKPFGYMRFTPGPGVGGHCLPIDPSYLSWRVERSLGQRFRFVELANDINQHMPDYVVRRLQDRLNDLSQSVRGAHVLVLGMAYKANTGDARETPSRPLIEQLQALGAVVSVADPHVEDHQLPQGVSRVDGSPADVARSDVAVLVVAHDAFDLDGIGAAETPVLDTRRCLQGANVTYL